MAAKTSIYPSEPAQDEEFRDQYIKSNHAYDVGQQKSRHYHWPTSIDQDKASHSFGVGVGSHKSMNNTSTNIQQQFEGVKGSTVAIERVEAIQGMKDQLGKCRNLLQTREVDPKFVYGRSDRRANDWDAKACLEGDYSYGEQAPDEDLGASVTPGFRKDATLLQEGRLTNHAFGVPSVPFYCPMFNSEDSPHANIS